MHSALQHLQNVLAERFPEASRRVASAGVLPTGMAEVDARLPGGGLPKGCLVELGGGLSSGKGTVIDRLVASLTLAAGWVGYVDLPATLYPPSLASAGARLDRLLIVRPSALPQALWACELLVRCRGFDLVVFDLTIAPSPVLAPAPLHRLARVAEQGQAVVLFVTQSSRELDRRPLPPGVTALRLAVTRSRCGLDVNVVRRRVVSSE